MDKQPTEKERLLEQWEARRAYISPMASEFEVMTMLRDLLKAIIEDERHG